MKLAGSLLALAFLALVLSPVSAKSEARADKVTGSLYVLTGANPTPAPVRTGQTIPMGSRLTAREGCTARIDVGTVGVLHLVGPASASIDLVDDVPAVRLLSGTGTFEWGGGKIVLEAVEGRLEVAGVAGYGGELPRPSRIRIVGKKGAARVEALAGGALLSGHANHVRLSEGDAVDLPLPSREGPGAGIRLRSREIEIELPPEAAKSLKGASNPALDELEGDWTQDRESPRVP